MVSTDADALAGKVAIITGAATGIGRASALLFARAGARVVLVDVRPAELEAAVEAVRAATGPEAAIPVVADLADPEQCATAVARAVEACGRLDVLFNNAGVGTMVVGGTVETIGLDLWDLAQDVNVRAMYLVSQAAVPHLRAAGGGSIVNTASVSALQASRGRPSHAYAASKGAVLALTRAMAVSLGQDRIRVNAICPGLIRSRPDGGHRRRGRRRSRRRHRHPDRAGRRAGGHRAVRPVPGIGRRVVYHRDPDRGRRRRDGPGLGDITPARHRGGETWAGSRIG